MFWKLEEARFRQELVASGAVAGLYVDSAQPGAGKVWIITAAGYYPDAAETRVVSFYKMTASGNIFCILNPISLALNPARATFISEGMEYILFPGEYIRARRDAATAGSVMLLNLQIIEIDLPLYTYDEPQIVKRQMKALSTIRSRLGGGLGSSSSGGGVVPPEGGGGGGGGGEPVL